MRVKAVWVGAYWVFSGGQVLFGARLPVFSEVICLGAGGGEVFAEVICLGAGGGDVFSEVICLGAGGGEVFAEVIG